MLDFLNKDEAKLIYQNYFDLILIPTIVLLGKGDMTLRFLITSLIILQVRLMPLLYFKS